VPRPGNSLPLNVIGDLLDRGVGEGAEPVFGCEREHRKGKPFHGELFAIDFRVVKQRPVILEARHEAACRIAARIFVNIGRRQRVRVQRAAAVEILDE